MEKNNKYHQELLEQNIEENKRKDQEINDLIWGHLEELLNAYKENIKAIDKLKGDKRVKELTKLKEYMVKQLATRSLGLLGLSKDKSQIFENEILKLYHYT